MNILIKNADFSAVSIGEAGKLIPSSVLTNAGLSYAGVDRMIYAASIQTLCYDISQLTEEAILKIVSYIGYNKSAYYFMSGDCPTQDVTLTSQDSLNTLFDSLGSILKYGYFPNDSNGLRSDIEANVQGAKTLMINVSAYADECGANEILQ